jgi:hypothetical protein
MTLTKTNTICESKGGSVGAEELQCWEANKSLPVYMTFKNVKTLNGGGLNRRMLTDGAIDLSEGGRRLQTSPFQFNCILSETDLSGTTSILINYERCQISSGTFEIGYTRAMGVGVTKYSSNLALATVILPSPNQDVLTTVVRDCNAVWKLNGYTNVLVYGSEVKSGCKIIADGTSDGANAILTIDFGQESCSNGHTVSLNQNKIVINGNEIVIFGTPFKDIFFAMSNCNDQVTISKTYSDTSSIEIIGYDGDDRIELGDSSKGFDTNIVGNIIIDGGRGYDTVIIHDESSATLKPNVAVRPTMISGIHTSSAHSIAYFHIENINMSLGTAPANVKVFSTPQNTALILATRGKFERAHSDSQLKLSHSFQRFCFIKDSDDLITIANGELCYLALSMKLHDYTNSHFGLCSPGPAHNQFWKRRRCDLNQPNFGGHQLNVRCWNTLSYN